MEYITLSQKGKRYRILCGDWDVRADPTDEQRMGGEIGVELGQSHREARSCSICKHKLLKKMLLCHLHKIVILSSFLFFAQEVLALGNNS